MTSINHYNSWFDPFAELTRNLLPDLDAILVCDHHGNVLVKRCFSDGVALPEPDLVSIAGRAKGVSVQRLGDTKDIIMTSIARPDGVRPDVLCVIAPATESAVTASALLRGLGPVVSRYCALEVELNTMTDELVRRYEELNLVYDTDDTIGTSTESERVLSRILDNCTESLQVDAAALILRDEERSTIHFRAPDDNYSARYNVLLKHPAMKSWLAGLKDAVVLNDPSERWHHGLARPGGEKLIACPLFDNQDHHYGTLLVINEPERRDFENSDRNLMTVLAEKATRVVTIKYDSLTGLLTREGFEQCVATAMREAKTQRRDSCLLHVNIDQMKLVNDTFGHEVGDDLLQQISDLMANDLRTKDRLARLGGDEFGILLPDCELDIALRKADRLCQAAANLSSRFAARQLDVGISIGVARMDTEVDSVIEIMALADMACTVAKEQGRGRSLAYTPDDARMHARKDQMHWVGRVQRALKSDQFVLFSQAIESTIVGAGQAHFEILLRMCGENGEILSPAVFMPVAERYQLMPTIDRWVTQHAIQTLGAWQDEVGAGNAVFAINLSGQSLTDERTLDHLLEQLKISRFDTRNLCFEITETAAITNLGAAQEFIRRVKQFGCKFALDDFGAGVSSFTNLRALQLDFLKIDGSFVVDMLDDPVSASMVAAINQVGQTMQLATVAEFVESQQHRDALAALGVDYLQGYDIGKPLPLLDQLEYLTKSATRSA